MAKRYSGNLQINVTYDDRGDYRTSVSSGGKSLWSGRVKPAPVGFGRGVAYDSPKAYDEIASSALSFADNEVSGISDDAEREEDGRGWLIRRTPLKRARSSHHVAEKRHHATRKSPAQVQREVDKILADSSFELDFALDEAIAKARTKASESNRRQTVWRTENDQLRVRPMGEKVNVLWRFVRHVPSDAELR